MPHTMSFPHALGTGIIAQTEQDLDPQPPSGDDLDAILEFARTHHGPSLYDGIDMFIDDYETALSRFRSDSTVTAMARAEHGGTFAFPDWAAPLFDLIDLLCEATGGAIDPCVGEDLIRLGYDAQYSFTTMPDTTGHLGAIHGRATWRDDVTRAGERGTTLVTHRPVSLDFGACGKGYLVDLIAKRLHDDHAGAFVIDAGGDLFVDAGARDGSAEPVVIALEDPSDADRAIGTANVARGAFCASAPSRRRWNARIPGESETIAIHHLLNAVDGRPVDDVAATWATVPMPHDVTVSRETVTREASQTQDSPATSPHRDAATGPILTAYPTALADGLATALFVTTPNELHGRITTLAPGLTFECAVLNADHTAVVSSEFPGTLFTA